MSLVSAICLSLYAGKAERYYEEIAGNISRYNRNFPPWDRTGDLSVIRIACYQIVLTSVDITTQTIGYITQINMTWHDYRLAYNATEYGSWNLLLPPESVWIPRIDIFNGKNNRDIKSDVMADVVEVRSDGMVSQVGYAYLESACAVNVDYEDDAYGNSLKSHETNDFKVSFPFDEQYCVISFVSSAVSSDLLQIYPVSAVNWTLGLSEWNFIDDAIARNISFPIVGRNYSIGQIVVHFKREPAFYIQLLIIPTFIVTTVCISAMLLPFELVLGERINLGLAGLLSLTFMLSIMLTDLPKSPRLPLLGKWVLAEVAMCSISMAIPMLLTDLESRLTKMNLRKWTKTISTALCVLVNLINILLSILLFVCRDKAVAPTSLKPI